jgi:flavin reductase (DIM6/NTAB) family NADH-FMN oxidoreductase RutF
MKRSMNPFTAVAPCPVVLLSVAGTDKPNIITLSWVANVCSRPPSIVAGIRPERHSYEMVKDANEFRTSLESQCAYDQGVSNQYRV